MASKIAIGVLNKVKDKESFYKNYIYKLFPNTPQHILNECITELIQEGLLFKHGERRGTFYSTKRTDVSKPNQGEEESENLELIKKFAHSKSEFTSAEVKAAFPNIQEHIVMQLLNVLRDEYKEIYMHGAGRNCIWSVSQDQPKPKHEEVIKKAVEQIKELALVKVSFQTNDIRVEFPQYEDSIIRLALSYLRDEEKFIYLHGVGAKSTWSILKDLPQPKENKKIELDREEFKEKILKITKEGERWFSISEIIEKLELPKEHPEYEIKSITNELVIYKLLKKIKRFGYVKYAYMTVDDEDFDICNDETKKNILDFMIKNGPTSIKQLMQEFSMPYPLAAQYIDELENSEDVYREGSKRSLVFMHKDYDAKKYENTKTEKQSNYSGEIIDDLSRMIYSGYTIYIYFNTKKNMYQLKTLNMCNPHILYESENAIEVMEQFEKLLIRGCNVTDK